MAVVVPRSWLSDAHVQDIRRVLIMQPKPTFNPISRKYVPGTPVHFYLSDEAEVRVPYAYAAASLLQRAVNQDRPHPGVELAFEIPLDVKRDQVDIVQEAWQQLWSRGTTILELPPGTGKTMIATYLVHLVKKVALILIHRDPLIQQWANTIYKAHSGASVWVVGHLVPDRPVTHIVCMYERIDQLSPEVRAAVGVLIIDEAHRFCTPDKIQALLAVQPSHIVACTATLEREADGMEIMMTALCGQHSVFRPCSKAFNYYPYFTQLYVPEMKGNRKWDETLKYIFRSDYRNGIALNMIQQYSTHKILVTCSYVKEHAQPFYELLVRNGVESSLYAGNKQHYVDARVVVISLGKGGEGFDPQSLVKSVVQGAVKPFDLLLNLTSWKNNGLTYQVFGRVLRAFNPSIVDFYDDNRIIQRHQQKRESWVKRNGGTVVRM